MRVVNENNRFTDLSALQLSNFSLYWLRRIILSRQTVFRDAFHDMPLPYCNTVYRNVNIMPLRAWFLFARRQESRGWALKWPRPLCLKTPRSWVFVRWASWTIWLVNTSSITIKRGSLSVVFPHWISLGNVGGKGYEQGALQGKIPERFSTWQNEILKTPKHSICTITRRIRSIVCLKYWKFLNDIVIKTFTRHRQL